MDKSADFKAQFRAAKSARAQAPKPTRAQLQALKERQRHETQQSDAEPMAAAGLQPAADPATATSFHPDSQATIIGNPDRPGPGQPSVSMRQPSVSPRDQSATSPYHAVAAPGPRSTTASVVVETSTLPRDFFGGSQSATNTIREEGEGENAIPKGFFEDKAAEAKAKGEKPKTQAELAAEYAEFMSEVETGTAQAATVQAAEEEDEAGDRERREEFENFVRAQRLEQLRAIAAARGDAGVATDPALDAAVSAVVDTEDVALPPAPPPRKRRKVPMARELAGLDWASSDDGGDEGDDALAAGGPLDWRAKSSGAA